MPVKIPVKHHTCLLKDLRPVYANIFQDLCLTLFNNDSDFLFQFLEVFLYFTIASTSFMHIIQLCRQRLNQVCLFSVLALKIILLYDTFNKYIGNKELFCKYI